MSEKVIDPAYIAAETYEDFFVQSIFKYWTPHLVERAIPLPGEQVLDVACGTGVAARAVVPLVGQDGKVTGLDKNSAMLSVACRKFSASCEDIDWQEGVAENLPFPGKSFDLILCQQGLQFFNDRAAAAREMRRVLRPGGRAVIAVWQAIENHPVYLRAFEILAHDFHVPLETLAAPFAYGNPAALQALLLTAGFTGARVDQVSQDVAFDQPERFLDLTLKGAAAVIPAYAELDTQSQSAVFIQAKAELAPFLAAYLHAGRLSFPMHANLAVAVC